MVFEILEVFLTTCTCDESDVGGLYHDLFLGVLEVSIMIFFFSSVRSFTGLKKARSTQVGGQDNDDILGFVISFWTKTRRTG